MIPRRANALNSYIYYTSQVNRYFTPVEPQNRLPIVDILREKENVWYLDFNGNAHNLNQGGKIGIGTTTPNYTLDVDGSTRIVNDLIVEGKILSSSGISSNTPVGSIMAYVGAIDYGSFGQDPDGWMVCDGRQLPPNGIYYKLFQLLGYKYGYGDSSADSSGNIIQKYLLPDYRGAFLRGSGDNTQNQIYITNPPVNYYGPALNQYQDACIEGHSHAYEDIYYTTSGQDDMDYRYPSAGEGQFTGARTGVRNSTTSPNQQRQSGETFTTNETRPYCYGINWIIKL